MQISEPEIIGKIVRKAFKAAEAEKPDGRSIDFPENKKCQLRQLFRLAERVGSRNPKTSKNCAMVQKSHSRRIEAVNPDQKNPDDMQILDGRLPATGRRP